MALYDLRRAAFDLRRRVHGAPKAKEPGPPDKIRRAYGTLGTSLKRSADEEKEVSAVTVHVVLHLPLPL